MVLSSCNQQWWLWTQEDNTGHNKGEGWRQFIWWSSLYSSAALQPWLWCQSHYWTQNLCSLGLSFLMYTTGIITPNSLHCCEYWHPLIHRHSRSTCHGAPSKYPTHAVFTCHQSSTGHLFRKSLYILVHSSAQLSHFQSTSLFLIFHLNNYRTPGLVWTLLTIRC